MANRNGRQSKARNRGDGDTGNFDRSYNETRRYRAGEEAPGADPRSDREPGEDRTRADQRFRDNARSASGESDGRVWRDGQEWRDEWRPRDPSRSSFAGDQGGYHPYDSRNYDSGGFGYGGTSGSGGGFGVGGAGPQAGGYGTQANYGQGYPVGDYDPDHREDFAPEARHRPSWLDSFPHSFSGWGPRAPAYENDPQRALGYTPRSGQRPEQDYGRRSHRNYSREMADEHPHDRHYRNWRDQQMRELDADYDAWRRENQSKFDEEFGGWRDKRSRTKRERPAGSAPDATARRRADAEK